MQPETGTASRQQELEVPPILQTNGNQCLNNLIGRRKAKQGTRGFFVVCCVNWGHFLRHFLLYPHKDGNSHNRELTRKI